jgi:prefoldin subunit 5
MPYDVPFAPTGSRSQELDALKDQAKYFAEALDEIKERIGELEKTETEG